MTAAPDLRPGGAGAASTSGREYAGLNSGAVQRLKEQQAVQDQLTDEMVGLAAQLKRNAMGMQESVGQRGRVLDSTEASLTASADAAKANAARAKEQLKRSGGNLCLTIMVLLAVGLAFTVMVVYVKFTYLLGHRAHTAVTAGPGAESGAPPVFSRPHGEL